jgi:hypothetical protein
MGFSCGWNNWPFSAISTSTSSAAALSTNSPKNPFTSPRRGNQIEYSAVVRDPGVLAEPWQMRPRRMTLMDKEMAEPAPCMDQDLHLMQDDSHHTNPR